jgi:hypothetical protein
VGHVVHVVEMRNLYKIVVRKPQGKRMCQKSEHRLEDNVKIDLHK